MMVLYLINFEYGLLKVFRNNILVGDDFMSDGLYKLKLDDQYMHCHFTPNTLIMK